jgi:hypothetical protein
MNALSITKRPSPALAFAGSGINDIFCISCAEIGQAKAHKAVSNIIPFLTGPESRLWFTPISLMFFLKSSNSNFAEAFRSGTKIPADAASRAAGFAGLALDGAALWLLIAACSQALHAPS